MYVLQSSLYSKYQSIICQSIKQMTLIKLLSPSFTKISTTNTLIYSKLTMNPSIGHLQFNSPLNLNALTQEMGIGKHAMTNQKEDQS